MFQRHQQRAAFQKNSRNIPTAPGAANKCILRCDSGRGHYSPAGRVAHFLVMLVVVLHLISKHACATSNAAAPPYNGNVVAPERERIEDDDEVHPIVMYKEDYVSEDYGMQEPDRSESVPPTKSRRWKAHRKAKRLRHKSAEHYNVLKPAVVYFDVLPKRPIIGDASKLEDTSAQIELVPLDFDFEEEKARHQRKRRAVEPPDQQHQQELLQLRNKRNSYYSFYSPNTEGTGVEVSNRIGLPPFNYHYTYLTLGNPSQTTFVRHPVRGKRPPQPAQQWPAGAGAREQQMTVGTRTGFAEDYDDRPVWGRTPIRRPAETLRTTAATTTTRRPKSRPTRPDPDFWHDSNPDNADFSLYTSTESPPPLPVVISEVVPTNVVLPDLGAARRRPLRGPLRPALTGAPPTPMQTDTIQRQRPTPKSSAAAGDIQIRYPQPERDATISRECRRAVNYCCSSPESERYICFHNLFCTFTIAGISDLCD